jgi:hypothetical protein
MTNDLLRNPTGNDLLRNPTGNDQIKFIKKQTKNYEQNFYT